MSHIIHSRNLFIDTTSGSGKGDEFNLELGANMLQAADGQFMRLTLVNFNMYNSIYPVNATNNKFRIVSRYGPPQNVSQFLGLSTLNSIPSKNYKTCGDIALAFAQAVQAQVQADARVASGNNALTTTLSGITTVDVQPPQGEGFSSTGDKILQFKITTSVPHTLTSVKIECLESLGESWMLLGGDRLTDQILAGTNEFGPGILGENSFQNTVAANEIVIQGKYPMQRSTSPQVYLRCDVPNDNIETASLNKIVKTGVGFDGDSTLSSNILGVFQLDHEFAHYDLLGDEFFLNLRSKNLSHMRLTLTDRKNRMLTHAVSSGADNQSTLGNLSFSCIIRIDTIQATIPRQLSVTPQQLPDLKKTGILSSLN